MEKEIQKKLEELRELYIKYSDNQTTQITLSLNAYGWDEGWAKTNGDTLRRKGTSQKNIAGEWIS